MHAAQLWWTAVVAILGLVEAIHFGTASNIRRRLMIARASRALPFVALAAATAYGVYRLTQHGW